MAEQSASRARLAARVGSAELTINVVDVNDERPCFELPVYIFDVEENQALGLHVGVVSPGVELPVYIFDVEENQALGLHVGVVSSDAGSFAARLHLRRRGEPCAWALIDRPTVDDENLPTRSTLYCRPEVWAAVDRKYNDTDRKYSTADHTNDAMVNENMPTESAILVLRFCIVLPTGTPAQLTGNAMQPTGSTMMRLYAADADADDGANAVFDVEENRAPGTAVGVVTATDRELPPFNRFTLRWASKEVEEFAIDSQTGVITTTQTLDHELQVVGRRRARLVMPRRRGTALTDTAIRPSVCPSLGYRIV